MSNGPHIVCLRRGCSLVSRRRGTTVRLKSCQPNITAAAPSRPSDGDPASTLPARIGHSEAGPAGGPLRWTCQARHHPHLSSLICHSSIGGWLRHPDGAGVAGHKDVQTTMIHTHVLNRGGRGAHSPSPGPGSLSPARPWGLCGPAGPHKIAEGTCGVQQKSLHGKPLPPRPAGGGFVLGRPRRGLCRSA